MAAETPKTERAKRLLTTERPFHSSCAGSRSQRYSLLVGDMFPIRFTSLYPRWRVAEHAVMAATSTTSSQQPLATGTQRPE